ncbi:MAG TPA: hypothetical protein VMV05_09285, partial [bacterium]|nr:hypothetical protein [bacterium]
MLYHSVGSALGFLILSFLVWSVTFAILVFGVMLRKKILLWDDSWKDVLEERGFTVKSYADGLQATFEKIRSTFRLLGFFLFIMLCLMIFTGYLNVGYERPILGYQQVISSLWLLSLVALSVVIPAFINFGIGTYIAETMLLKANAFVYREVKEEMKEKRAKIKMMEMAKEMKAKREAL